MVLLSGFGVNTIRHSLTRLASGDHSSQLALQFQRKTAMLCSVLCIQAGIFLQLQLSGFTAFGVSESQFTRNLWDPNHIISGGESEFEQHVK